MYIDHQVVLQKICKTMMNFSYASQWVESRVKLRKKAFYFFGLPNLGWGDFF
jgi:hypothetical protein